MPATDTITAFNEFSANTTISSADVNTNFSNFRGHSIPIDPTAAAAVSDSYDLGSDTYKWRYVYQGQHEVHVYGGNGAGSTNTFIRRFNTIGINTGTGITYADDASLGASFTINVGGAYNTSYSDAGTTSAIIFGTTKDSPSLATNLISVADQTKVMNLTFASDDEFGCASGSFYAAAGSVVRAHVGNSVNHTGDQVMFRIVKVG